MVFSNLCSRPRVMRQDLIVVYGLTMAIIFLQDVGKAVLESYSRVLEGLAFNIVAWIEDVLYVDKSMRNRDV